MDFKLNRVFYFFGQILNFCYYELNQICVLAIKLKAFLVGKKNKLISIWADEPNPNQSRQ